MFKKITHKITLPESIPNTTFNEQTLIVNGKEETFRNGQSEHYNINDIDYDLLSDGLSKIEDLAYSDEQLKSINDFLIENHSRLYTLNLSENNMYQYWTVHKRYDDILFRIYEVWGADMTIEDKKYLFPFVGGRVEVSDTVKFNPERNGFEYQFHLYNNNGSE
ncbi:hypothetical protein [Croceibacter atlanticus]|uniref:hypothetical protein n=1 Tax=Croceibacter atlanticus TaxID=313588 RepID=UPI0030F52F0A